MLINTLNMLNTTKKSSDKNNEHTLIEGSFVALVNITDGSEENGSKIRQ